MPGMELRTGDENDSLIQSFDKRFLSSHSVSGTVLSAWDRLVN